MAFDGFYFDMMTWFGNATFTRKFNFGSTPVNAFAWGALGAVAITGGTGVGYVGIMEEEVIDPNTGRPINKSTMILGQNYPHPNYADLKVLSMTFLVGSNIPNINTVAYANASLNILLWS